MKKPLALLLVCIHLAGNTEAGQIFRLPMLLRHFQFHHDTDPSLHFIHFLAMHYAGDDGTSSDDTEDAKLPFHDYTHSSVIIVYAPMVRVLTTTIVIPPPDRDQVIEKKVNITSKHVMRILQPPR